MNRKLNVEIVRKVVEHEDNLINHRFSWLVLSQSFLVVAWFQLDAKQLSNFGDALGWLGFVACLFPYLSIWAAILALCEIRATKEFSDDQESDEYPKIMSGKYRHWFGLSGAILTPMCFLGFWLWTL